MRVKIYTLSTALVTICLLLSPKTAAAGLQFQPRIETGLMYYSFEESPVSRSTLPQAGQSSGSSYALEKMKFSDNLWFVGGGATLVFQRLFVDLSGQYAFDGRLRNQTSEAQYDENQDLFVSSVIDRQGNFDRTDTALSMGYAVNGKFSVYAGYKWATVEANLTFDAPTGFLVVGNALLSGRLQGVDRDKFQYAGPFIGLTHGWEIDRCGFFNGLLSAKVALAWLSSKFNKHTTGVITIDSVDGAAIEPTVDAIDHKSEYKGDTLGFAVGFDWHGATAIKNLSYWIGLSGYRYNFDSENVEEPEFNETAIMFKAGLTCIF
jgi:hypothetical protein